MLHKSVLLWSYQRGGWKPGTKHQKHMSLNPTHYLYRFPGPRGPGPYTMKYWWTLGCFPTGLTVPFRLDEFLSSYQQSHVPIEVEEWLHYMVRQPLDELQSAVSVLCCCIDDYPTVEEGRERGYEVPHVSVHSIAAPLQSFQRSLGVVLSPSSVRKTLCFNDLRERVVEDLEEYKDLIAMHGSTPHRRAARQFLSSETEVEELDRLPPQGPPMLNAEIASSIGGYASPPTGKTMPDELKLIRLLTTFAEGSARGGALEDALDTLYSTLPHAHDANTKAVVHANISSAALLSGEFKEAEFHAKESVLNCDSSPQMKMARSKHSYQLWASALVYQEEYTQATSVLEEAIALLKNDAELREWHGQVVGAGKRVNEVGVGPRLTEMRRRNAFPAVQSKKLANGEGKAFDNEFSWVVFRQKLYPSKMNPSSNEMGSVFRRVGDMGGHISTSRSMEIL